jgi:pimeloyl-ACP methyl ester carboxylesterase
MFRKFVYGLAALLVVGAVTVLYLSMNPDVAQRLFLKPSAPFDVASAPPAPDYKRPESWASLPDMEDPADTLIPGSGYEDGQADAQVDVFFIHPTTYYSKDGWNAAYDEGGETRELLEAGVLRFQASTFNGDARIYAPRYRQATLYSFMGDGEDEQKALAFAYEDVARAFRHFIETYNQGRPFILAAHSQGSLHGMRLLQERIAGTPLANRMVAAYLVGYSIPEDMGRDDLRPCKEAYSTGCYLNWNSISAEADRNGWTQSNKIWLNGEMTTMAGHRLTCVNPLTGMKDGKAGAEKNLGGLPFAEADSRMPELIPSVSDAACESGVLIVNPDEDRGDFSYGVFDGDFHIYDYNLFYANIRQDIRTRIGAFWKR